MALHTHFPTQIWSPGCPWQVFIFRGRGSNSSYLNLKSTLSMRSVHFERVWCKLSNQNLKSKLSMRNFHGVGRGGRVNHSIQKVSESVVTKVCLVQYNMTRHLVSWDLCGHKNVQYLLLLLHVWLTCTTMNAFRNLSQISTLSRLMMDYGIFSPVTKP